jgi:ribosomal protein L2
VPSTEQVVSCKLSCLSGSLVQHLNAKELVQTVSAKKRKIEGECMEEVGVLGGPGSVEQGVGSV